MTLRHLALSAAGTLLLQACATPATAAPHPEAAAFSATADAAADFAAARARSAASGKPLLLVLGANWCHDSRALAGWLDTPRFRQLVAANFELLFVDVGRPQTGAGRNLAIPRSFGVDELKSTPALLVIGPDGALRNRATATDWGNAGSRSGDAIYAALSAFAPRSPAG